MGDVHWVPYLTWVAGCGRFEVGVEEAEVVEGDKGHSEGVHDGWKRKKERVQEAEFGLPGFGTEQTLAGLSLSLCLWARTGSGGETGGGDGFLQALNTLVPGLESPQGGCGTLDLCQWKEVPQEGSLFLQWEDTLCESGLLQMRGFVPGPWEEGSLGWMSLGDAGGGVGAGRYGKGDWGCFGVMQVGLGSAWG